MHHIGNVVAIRTRRLDDSLFLSAMKHSSGGNRNLADRVEFGGGGGGSLVFFIHSKFFLLTFYIILEFTNLSTVQVPKK